MLTSPGAIYLALDTATPIGSVAVSRDGDVVAVVRLDRRARHASLLIPAIDEALTSAGVAKRDLDGVVVGEGPGSFTGVRVGAATAKGLARALDLPLWAVSSLAGTALSLRSDPVRYALFDARGERIYGACYSVGATGVHTLVEPHAGTLTEVLDSDATGGAIFVGDAAIRHRSLLLGAGLAVAEEDDGDTVAEGLLRYLALRTDATAVSDVGAWEPAYLREWGPVSA